MWAIPPTPPGRTSASSPATLAHTDDDDWHESWSLERVDPEDPYRNAPIGSPYSDD